MVRNIGLLSLLLVLDLFSKSYFFANPELQSQILPFFSITLAKNTGMSFGMAQNWVSVITLVNGFLLLCVTAMLFWEKDWLTKKLWLFVLAGGLANFYDRALLGYVRDFLHLHVAGYSWPVFNLADCYITLSVLLLIITHHNKSSKA